MIRFLRASSKVSPVFRATFCGPDLSVFLGLDDHGLSAPGCPPSVSRMRAQLVTRSDRHGWLADEVNPGCDVVCGEAAGGEPVLGDVDYYCVRGCLGYVAGTVILELGECWLIDRPVHLGGVELIGVDETCSTASVKPEH